METIKYNGILYNVYSANEDLEYGKKHGHKENYVHLVRADTDANDFSQRAIAIKFLEANGITINKDDNTHTVISQLLECLRKPETIKELNDSFEPLAPITKKKVFIVFQQPNYYKEQKEKGIISAANVKKDGKHFYSWDTLTEVNIGDIIFHMSDKKIKSISVAKSKAYSVNGKNNIVKCDYHELENPLDLDKFRDEIKTACEGVENAPFNINGKGNNGYLYYLPQSLVDLFPKEAKSLNPEMDLTFLNDISTMKAIQNDEDIDMNKHEIGLNTILYGPPGTGKTYNTKRYVVSICDNKSLDEVEKMDYKSEIILRYNELLKEGRVMFTTFHQSYGYEEFIEGIKPVVDDNNVIYKVIPGLFKQFCDDAKENLNHNYVFIIDEINRGNISKIFGELITLIETSKRLGNAESMESILPYSGEKFGVPNNVYILGTMNTADRSISLMDTALRRRFDFVEMMPDSKILANLNVKGVNVKEMLDVINKRITVLYDREHTIGHAFFTELNDKSTISDLGQIFKNKIIPLLQEYFYEDYSKIRLVLGDNGKSDEKHQFVKEIDNTKKNIFKGNFDPDIAYNVSYELNDEALDNAESYIEIYK